MSGHCIRVDGFLQEWGIEVQTVRPTELPPCERIQVMEIKLLCCHFFNNNHMKSHFDKPENISNATTTDVLILEMYKKKLDDIHAGNCINRNTVFHCTGVPFTKTSAYDEVDWNTRLYFCLVGQLPQDLKLYDTNVYQRRFKQM